MIRTPLLFMTLALLSTVASVDARPLYAMRTGRPCSSCHVDPAGGGVRTGTGFRYAVNGHTLVPAEEVEPLLDPRITDGIRLGADIRTQYHQDANNELRSRSSFFQMQAALYIAADLNDRLTIVYANEQGQTQETFALLHGFPVGGTIKVGRFRPAYGLELEDHTAFTRDALGIGNGSEETGIEISLVDGNRMVNLAVTNGVPGGRAFDDNEQKAFFGRVWWYNERFGFGASGSANRPGVLGGEITRLYRYGAFGQFHHGPLVLLAEYDRGRTETDNTPDVDLEAVLCELSYLIADRLTAKLRYDRFDPDLQYAETASDRFGLGLEHDLFPLTRILVLTRLRRDYGFDDQGVRVFGKTRDTIEFLGQLHVSF